MEKFTLLIFFVSQLLLSGCKKKELPMGLYKTTFIYVDQESINGVVEISESFDTKLVIGLDTLFKDGKKINGTLIGSGNNLPSGVVEIKGEWSRPFNDDRYFIKGAFIQHYYSHLGYEGDFYGTFEIKSY